MPFDGWVNGNPPKDWLRLLACDVGGATAWSFEWSAIDPENNIVFYDEIYRVTTDVDKLAEDAVPKMFDEDRQPYRFRAKIIDYENKLAAEDLRKRGISFTNAQKHAKASSIHRLASYLHPNPRHHFPEWHPLAGLPNAPRLFITRRCPNLIRELPLQRWKEDSQTEKFKNEPDRRIENHATDCVLYTVRELPEVAKLKPSPPKALVGIDLRSALYWEDVRRAEERKSQTSRERGYRIKKVFIDTLN